MSHPQAASVASTNAGPPRYEGGVFKLTTNHLWTCDEQPEWGNVVRLEVYDSDGNPMPGVTIRVGWPDTTERPIYNDTDPPDPSEIPETVTTGSEGVFSGFNYWPTNVNGYSRAWMERVERLKIDFRTAE